MNGAVPGVGQPVPTLPELQFIAVDANRCGLEGPRMSYLEAGAEHKKIVLLLHGISSNAQNWRYLMDALRHSFRVIAWNAPGYYLSDHLRDETPTNFQYADVAAALLDALGVESAHVAGSSLGSLIAASFAARHPNRVERLALLSVARGQKWRPPAEREGQLRARQESIRNGGIGLAQTRWQNLLSKNASETAIRLAQEGLKAIDPRAYMQAARASDSTDVLDFAGSIRAPTLVILGTEDQVTPPEIGRVVHRAIPRSRLLEIDAAGHFLNIEVPHRLVPLLSEHFQG